MSARRRSGCTAVLALLCALLVAGPASAADQYAAPNGVGSACSAAAPCALAQAFANAANGDHILLAGGQYDTGPIATLSDNGRQLDIGPAPGASSAPSLSAGEQVVGSYLRLATAGSVIHDVFMGGPRVLDVRSGARAERVRVASGAADPCVLGPGGILTDSACQTFAGSLTSGALRTEGAGAAQIVVRNVTVLAYRNALYTDSPAPVLVTNSILRANDNDVVANQGAVTLTNDAFDPLNTSTGMGGSFSHSQTVTAPPVFENPFSAVTLAGSPTIDAGDDALGSSSDRDMAGNARRLGAHIDIGAFEFASPPAVNSNITAATPTSVTFNLMVATNGSGVTVYAAAGETQDLDHRSVDRILAASSTPEFVAITISGLKPNTVYNYAVRLQTPRKFLTGDAGTFMTGPAPEATISDASAVTATTAHLAGSAVRHGLPTTGHFECAPAGGGATVSTPEQAVPADGPVHADISGLTPRTTYSCRLVLDGQGAPGVSGATQFTTAPPVPDATMTLGAVAVGRTSATIRGTAFTYGEAGTAHFVLTPPSGPAIITPDRPTHGGGLSADVTGLTAGTKYIVALHVETPGGVVDSGLSTFTTLRDPPQAVTADDATDITTTSATLHGTVTFAPGGTGTARFVVGGTVTDEQDATGGAVATTVTGLTPNTTYAFVVRASTASDEVQSAPRLFTTLPGPVDATPTPTPTPTASPTATATATAIATATPTPSATPSPAPFDAVLEAGSASRKEVSVLATCTGACTVAAGGTVRVGRKTVGFLKTSAPRKLAADAPTAIRFTFAKKLRKTLAAARKRKATVRCRAVFLGPDRIVRSVLVELELKR